MYTLDILHIEKKLYAEAKKMESSKVNALMTKFEGKIPEDQKVILKNKLMKAEDETYDVLDAMSLKNKTTTLLLAIFLGGLGVDRFYIGDVGKGIAKLLLGWLTLGLWPFIDIFVSYRKAKAKNIQKIMMNIY